MTSDLEILVLKTDIMLFEDDNCIFSFDDLNQRRRKYMVLIQLIQALDEILASKGEVVIYFMYPILLYAEL
jgi:hypothetical protein